MQHNKNNNNCTNNGCFLGVVTMEDIIETIIGREIVDESDTVVDLQAYAREKWLKQIK